MRQGLPGFPLEIPAQSAAPISHQKINRLWINELAESVPRDGIICREKAAKVFAGADVKWHAPSARTGSAYRARACDPRLKPATFLNSCSKLEGQQPALRERSRYRISIVIEHRRLANSLYHEAVLPRIQSRIGKADIARVGWKLLHQSKAAIVA